MEFLDSIWGLIVWIIMFIVSTFIITLGIIVLANYISFPGNVAEIERIRQDVAVLDENERKTIIRQIIEVSRIIESKKVYNQLWWSRVFVPNGWDKIKPIDVTVERQDSD